MSRWPRRLPAALAAVLLGAVLLVHPAAAQDAPAAAASAAAQASGAQAASLVLLPRWRVGEVQHYSYSKQRERRRSGQAPTLLRSQTPMDIAVLAVDATGLRLRLGYGATALEGVPPGPEGDMLRALSGLLQAVQIEVQVDRAGQLLQVHNWQQVRDLVTQALQQLSGPLQAQGLPAAALDAMRQQIQAAYASEAAVRASSMNELRLLLMPLGKPLGTGQPWLYDTVLPNPLGGDPIAAQGRLTLAALDSAAGEVQIDWQQQADPAQLQASVRQALSQMAERLGRPMPADTVLPALTLHDSGEMRVQLASGWPMRVRHVRHSGTADDGQTETTTLQRR